jgi:hypothetical protein
LSSKDPLERKATPGFPEPPDLKDLKESLARLELPDLQVPKDLSARPD